LSSTNRTNAKERNASDYYVTPINVVELFLKEFLKRQSFLFNLDACDPCAGGDEMNEMSYPTVMNKFKQEFQSVYTIDIREDSKAFIKEDFLEMKHMKDRFDMFITNPPFNLSQKIIEKCLEDVKEKGYVIMLLRLNFLGGQKRKAFFEKYKPSEIYVHSKRISFLKDEKGRGITDSIEYAHFVWEKKETKETRLYII
jgi:hypothetical protein